MKMEVLCGPAEWGIRMHEEPGDDIAWDAMVDRLREWDGRVREARDLEAFRILANAVPHVQCLLPDHGTDEHYRCDTQARGRDGGDPEHS